MLNYSCGYKAQNGLHSTLLKDMTQAGLMYCKKWQRSKSQLSNLYCLPWNQQKLLIAWVQLGPSPVVPLFLTPQRLFRGDVGNLVRKTFECSFSKISNSSHELHISWTLNYDMASVTLNPKFSLLYGPLSLAAPTDHEHPITHFVYSQKVIDDVP